MQPCWRMPPFTIFSLHVIRILPPKLAEKAAGFAAAPCILAIIGASHAAGFVVWDDWRFSLCCARHGCRTRKTPPSLRFLGPKVYVAAALILITLLHDGVTPTRMQRLKELIGVDRRSLERWRRWWREGFTAIALLQAARAAVVAPVAEAHV